MYRITFDIFTFGKFGEVVDWCMRNIGYRDNGWTTFLDEDGHFVIEIEDEYATLFKLKFNANDFK